MTNYRAAFFSGNARRHRDVSSSLVGMQFDTFFLPYYKAEYHYPSILHPFYHAAKSILSAARIIKGGFLLLAALVNDPITAVPQVIGGIFNEVATTILNLINTAASIISLFTRSLATLFCGYSKNVLDRQADIAISAYGEVSMLPAMGFGLIKASAEAIDREICTNTAALTL